MLRDRIRSRRRSSKFVVSDRLVRGVVDPRRDLGDDRLIGILDVVRDRFEFRRELEQRKRSLTGHPQSSFGRSGVIKRSDSA